MRWESRTVETKMTQFEGQQEQSAFNPRADNAALKIKEQLGQELSALTGQQVVIPPSPVAVGADGQPVGQLPPEGSYAREAVEQQQAAAAQSAQQMAHLQAHDPGQIPAQGQPQAPPPQQPQETSQRAEQRIQDLINQLRAKDQELQTVQQQQAGAATTLEETRAQLTASTQQMQSLMQEHMEHMDPETRAQVLNNAQIAQTVAAAENRILGQVQPQLQSLQTRNDQLEKVRVGDVYQGYNPMVHDQLIDEFRKGNPNCSIEQAFRAVATPEELSVHGAGRATAPPPAVPPGSGAPTPRYLPTHVQQGQPDPLQQMVADRDRASELARSADPEDQKKATALWHKNLTERLGLNVPGG
jgi:hypothetical protein